MDELIKVSLVLDVEDGKAVKLSEEWELLKDKLSKSWKGGFATYIDSDSNEMVKFLYENKAYLIGKGLLNKERYDAILHILDLLVRFAWNPDNKALPFLKQRNMKILLEEIEQIRSRLNMSKLEDPSSRN